MHKLRNSNISISWTHVTIYCVLPGFVHGQPPRKRTKPTTKNCAGFQNHLLLLTMIRPWQKKALRFQKHICSGHVSPVFHSFAIREALLSKTWKTLGEHARGANLYGKTCPCFAICVFCILFRYTMLRAERLCTVYCFREPRLTCAHYILVCTDCFILLQYPFIGLHNFWPESPLSKTHPSVVNELKENFWTNQLA